MQSVCGYRVFARLTSMEITIARGFRDHRLLLASSRTGGIRERPHRDSRAKLACSAAKRYRHVGRSVMTTATRSLCGRQRERAALSQLLCDVRSGRSRVLVIRGEPGIGKTALLDDLCARADDVVLARVAGVESEMELAFAALQQLCAPMLDKLAGLPVPQRTALGVAFGLSAGAAPDRFLVGLAVLSLLSEVAGQQPLLCVVDDAQWLDRASAQALAFAARRLLAEPVALIFAAREPAGEFSGEFTGLPEQLVRGLGVADARALLGSYLSVLLDEQVYDRIVAEMRGNPLALLELPRG